MILKRLGGESQYIHEQWPISRRWVRIFVEFHYSFFGCQDFRQHLTSPKGVNWLMIIETGYLTVGKVSYPPIPYPTYYRTFR